MAPPPHGLRMIRDHLRELTKDSERDDFKVYIEDAILEPIFESFFNDGEMTELHPIVVTQMAQHALNKLQHSFNLEIRNGQRDLKTRLSYGESDHRSLRDTRESRIVAQDQLDQYRLHFDQLKEALGDDDDDTEPCGPRYISRN